MPLPRWIEPQLCKLATKAPSGAQWAHEIKLDGYRMAARIEGGRVKLLTRSGLDWTAKYPTTAAVFARLPICETQRFHPLPAQVRAPTDQPEATMARSRSCVCEAPLALLLVQSR